MPDWMQRYALRKSETPSLSTPIKDLRIVALDTETTGLNLSKDWLLSIGAVVIQDKSILVEQSLEAILYSEIKIKKESISIHGLRQKDIQLGEEREIALAHFLAYLDNSLILAHHTHFDVTMLNNALQEFHPKFKLFNRQLDTAFMAIRLEHGRTHHPHQVIDKKRYTLDALCERYDVEIVERHTAWGDAYTTALLYLKLLRLLERKGASLLRDIL